MITETGDKCLELMYTVRTWEDYERARAVLALILPWLMEKIEKSRKKHLLQYRVKLLDNLVKLDYEKRLTLSRV